MYELLWQEILLYEIGRAARAHGTEAISTQAFTIHRDNGSDGSVILEVRS